MAKICNITNKNHVLNINIRKKSGKNTSIIDKCGHTIHFFIAFQNKNSTNINIKTCYNSEHTTIPKNTTSL